LIEAIDAKFKEREDQKRINQAQLANYYLEQDRQDKRKLRHY